MTLPLYCSVMLTFGTTYLLYVGYLQVENMVKFGLRNGAGRERIALMLGSVAAIGIMVSLLMRSPESATWFLMLVPIIGTGLYLFQRPLR